MSTESRTRRSVSPAGVHGKVRIRLLTCRGGCYVVDPPRNDGSHDSSPATWTSASPPTLCQVPDRVPFLGKLYLRQASEPPSPSNPRAELFLRFSHRYLCRRPG